MLIIVMISKLIRTCVFLRQIRMYWVSTEIVSLYCIIYKDMYMFHFMASSIPYTGL